MMMRVAVLAAAAAVLSHGACAQESAPMTIADLAPEHMEAEAATSPTLGAKDPSDVSYAYCSTNPVPNWKATWVSDASGAQGALKADRYAYDASTGVALIKTNQVNDYDAGGIVAFNVSTGTVLWSMGTPSTSIIFPGMFRGVPIDGMVPVIPVTGDNVAPQVALKDVKSGAQIGATYTWPDACPASTTCQLSIVGNNGNYVIVAYSTSSKSASTRSLALLTQSSASSTVFTRKWVETSSLAEQEGGRPPVMALWTNDGQYFYTQTGGIFGAGIAKYTISSGSRTSIKVFSSGTALSLWDYQLSPDGSTIAVLGGPVGQYDPQPPFAVVNVASGTVKNFVLDKVSTITQNSLLYGKMWFSPNGHLTVLVRLAMYRLSIDSTGTPHYVAKKAMPEDSYMTSDFIEQATVTSDGVAFVYTIAQLYEMSKTGTVYRNMNDYSNPRGLAMAEEEGVYLLTNTPGAGTINSGIQANYLGCGPSNAPPSKPLPIWATIIIILAVLGCCACAVIGGMMQKRTSVTGPPPTKPAMGAYSAVGANTGQPSYGVPGDYGAQPQYNAGAPGYGAPQPAYGAPQPAYGAPQPAYGAPQPAYGGAPAASAPPAYGAPPPQAGYAPPAGAY